VRCVGTSSQAREGGFIGVIVGVLGLAASSLVVLSARTRAMMDLSVGAREYGHWLGAANLFFGIWSLSSGSRRSRAVRLLNLLSGTVLLVPALWARTLADNLRRESIEAFGDASHAPESAPFRLSRLFRPFPERARSIKKSTLIYGEAAGCKLKLDLYTDERNASPVPCVAVVPGGSWQRSDRRKFTALNSYLASRGYSVAVVEYRTAPEFRFPAALEDVRRALAYLKENAANLGIDPARFVLLGKSAGAQLALLEAYAGGDKSIRGVISFYGPTDLPYAYAHPTNPRVANIRRLLEDYLGGSPEEKDEAYRDASPINFASPHSPPTLLVHGSRDDMVQLAHSERLASRLKELSVPHLLVRLPWATHGFDHNLRGPGGQLSTHTVESFLAAVVDRDAP
jgi:acetyl esterase/lipase